MKTATHRFNSDTAAGGSRTPPVRRSTRGEAAGERRWDTENPLFARMRLLVAVATLSLGLAGPGAEVFAQTQERAEVSTVSAQAININTASAEELAQALAGVGGSKAEAIIRYRERFGAFESVDEITEVDGIGIATLEMNRGMIRIE